MISLDKLLEYYQADPDNDELALEVVAATASSGDIEAAFDFLEKNTGKYGDDVRFQAWYAHLYIAQMKFEEAAKIYKKIFEKGIVSDSLRINYAYALFNAGNNPDALKILNDCSSVDPEHQILKVRCMSSQDDLSLAIDILVNLDVLEISEKIESERVGLLALLYLDDGNYVHAEKSALASLNIDKTNFDARLVIATLLLFKLKTDEASVAINSLYDDFPLVGRVLVIKALLEMYSNNIEFAISLYEKACKVMPFHCGSKVNLAWCYFLKGDLENAEDNFQASIELDKNFAEAYGGMSMIRASQQLWIEVKKLSKVALRLDSSCASALFSRAIYLDHIGKAKESELIMNGIVKFSSDATDKTIKDVVLERLSMRLR